MRSSLLLSFVSEDYNSSFNLLSFSHLSANNHPANERSAFAEKMGSLRGNRVISPLYEKKEGS